jgi:hypothetical protein
MGDRLRVDRAFCFGENCMPTAAGCQQRSSQVAGGETMSGGERK